MRTMVLRGFSLLHFAQAWQCCLKLIIILKPKQKSENVDIRASGAEKEIVAETDVIPDKPQRKQGKKVETLFQALYLAETEKAIIQ